MFYELIASIMQLQTNQIRQRVSKDWLHPGLLGNTKIRKETSGAGEDINFFRMNAET